MEIPQNNFNLQQFVDEAVKTITDKLSNSEYHWTSYNCMHQRCNITSEIAEMIAKPFKNNGWYVYKLVRFDGVILEIQVFNKPQQEDYSHLNHFIRM